MPLPHAHTHTHTHTHECHNRKLSSLRMTLINRFLCPTFGHFSFSLPFASLSLCLCLCLSLSLSLSVSASVSLSLSFFACALTANETRKLRELDEKHAEELREYKSQVAASKAQLQQECTAERRRIESTSVCVCVCVCVCVSLDE